VNGLSNPKPQISTKLPVNLASRTASSASASACYHSDPEPSTSFFQRRIVNPMLDLLRVGCSPRKLAWSLAAGIVIGINPLLGSTTLAALILAWVLRLNLVASQIGNHIVYPLQLLLFLFFIKIGDRLFHTGRMPLEGHALFHAARVHPWSTTRILWTWEWHALIVWAVVAGITAPVLAAIFTPIITRLHTKLHHDQVAA
jgi:uncharacterized protein (DUF2062 family)